MTGIRLINDNNVVIVDENYVCLALRQWGNGWANNPPNFNYPPGGVGIQDITYTGGTAPVLAIYKNVPVGRDDMGAGVIGRAYNASTNTWTFRIMVTERYGQDYSYSYYVFDRPLATILGVKVNVFDGAGRCVFSNRDYPMITKAYSPSLPTGKWAHTFNAGYGVQNDTYDISNGSGGVQWIDRVTYSLQTWGCSPNSVFQSTRRFSQDGYDNYVGSGLENNLSTGTFLVDVSRIK
jgi:hypothetical protein